MLAYLNGKLHFKEPDRAIIDVSGVGYEVLISLNTFYELPLEESPVSFFIHTHVREDSFLLFGFLSLQEKTLFQKLIKVSGVGPKMAMTLLSGLSANDLFRAINSQDIATLKNIPGVGQKTAERILLDLKGKLPTSQTSETIKHENGDSTYHESLSALVNLGYSRSQADKALSKLGWESGIKLEEAIKQALRELVG